MNKDYSKSYIKWIGGLTQDQFDGFVKLYLQIDWGIDNVELCNGPNDGGIDVRYFENNGRVKIPLQITIQENVRKKLSDDLPKVYELINKEGYNNEFFFFYRNIVSDDSIRAFEREAKVKYGISLRIIDGNSFSAIVQRPEYKALRLYIKDTFGELLIEDIDSIDNTDKLRFDLIAYSSESVEVKNRIVQSFILSELFNKNTLNRQELLKSAASKFKLPFEHCNRQLNTLFTIKKVVKVEGELNKIKLSSEEAERIRFSLETITLQESEFLLRINTIIEKFKLMTTQKDLMEQLLNLFIENYNLDFKEISENDEGADIVKNAPFIKFQAQIKKILSNKKQFNEVLVGLMEICRENDYLQRIAAGKSFYKIVRNNNLQQYYNRQPKKVYLDTPLLLYLLCIFYKDIPQFPNFHFKVARDFYQYLRTSTIKLDINISDYYIREVSFQFLNAQKLSLISNQGFFKILGPTGNVIFNYFEYLDTNNLLNDGIETFEDFLNEYGLLYDHHSDTRKLEFIEEKIGLIFTTNGYSIFNADQYQVSAKQKQRYNQIKRELELIHSKNGDFRTPKSIENDACMLNVLYEESIEDIDPTIVTWDNSFFEIRKSFFGKHPGFKYWFLFSPAKYIDHLALLRFDIDGDILTDEILSIVESDFDMPGKVKYLKDAIVRILDLKTASGIKLANGLAEIRQNFILNSSERGQADFEKTKILPLDEIFIYVSQYYIGKKGKYGLQDFSKLVSKDENVESVLQCINDELNNYLESRKISGTILKNIDLLINIDLNTRLKK